MTKIRRVMCKIKNKFKKEYASYGEGSTPFVPHYGFIVPHSSQAQGAQRYDGKLSEYLYALFMVQSIDIPNARRDNGGVLGAAKELASKGVNFSIEPHFNSFNSHAKGCEILVLEGDKLSEHYARLFVEDFAMKFSKKLRHDNGIKFVSPGDRGYRNLKDAKKGGMKVAMLTELFFGDNVEDYVDFQEQAIFWRNNLIPLAEMPI